MNVDEAVVERPVVWPTVGRVGGRTIPVFSSEEIEELLGGVDEGAGNVA